MRSANVLQLPTWGGDSGLKGGGRAGPGPAHPSVARTAVPTHTLRDPQPRRRSSRARPRPARRLGPWRSRHWRLAANLPDLPTLKATGCRHPKLERPPHKTTPGRLSARARSSCPFPNPPEPRGQFGVFYFPIGHSLTPLFSKLELSAVPKMPPTSPREQAPGLTRGTEPPSALRRSRGTHLAPHKRLEPAALASRAERRRRGGPVGTW